MRLAVLRLAVLILTVSGALTGCVTAALSDLIGGSSIGEMLQQPVALTKSSNSSNDVLDCLVVNLDRMYPIMKVITYPQADKSMITINVNKPTGTPAFFYVITVQADGSGSTVKVQQSPTKSYFFDPTTSTNVLALSRPEVDGIVSKCGASVAS